MQPGKYFISHAYKDSDVRDKILTRLPEGVEPFIFPPINVSPLEFVSNTLIGSILTCDAMIYLNEGDSSQSFWVAFERDYASRSGKTIYSYTPSTQNFALHKSQPLDLAVFPSYSQKQVNEVMPILDFMRAQRFFDVWIDREKLTTGASWVEGIEEGVRDTLERGGYVTVFWSDASEKSEWVKQELFSGLTLNRVVFAGLDNAPMPDFLKEFSSEDQGSPFYVKLVDDNGLNHNRLDDLIVRLYWLIFQNQFPELGYE